MYYFLTDQWINGLRADHAQLAGTPRAESTAGDGKFRTARMPPTRTATVYETLSAGSVFAPGKGKVKFDKPKWDASAYVQQDDEPTEVLNYIYATVLPGARVVCLLNQPTVHDSDNDLRPRYAAVAALDTTGGQPTPCMFMGRQDNFNYDGGTDHVLFDTKFINNAAVFESVDNGGGTAYEKIKVKVEGDYRIEFGFTGVISSGGLGGDTNVCSNSHYREAYVGIDHNNTGLMQFGASIFNGRALCGETEKKHIYHSFVAHLSANDELRLRLTETGANPFDATVFLALWQDSVVFRVTQELSGAFTTHP